MTKSKNIFSMLKLRVRLRDLLIGAIGIIAGVILCNWSYFTLDKSIKISDLFSLIIGSYIGLYVGSKLTSRVSSDRAQKDLIISDLKIVRANFLKLISLFEVGNLPFGDTVTLFKTSSQNIASIKETLSYCRYDGALTADIINILASIRKIHNDTTSVAPVNDVISIPQPDLVGLLARLRGTNQKLNKFMIEINKAEES